MAILSSPLFSFFARGRLSRSLSLRRRGGLTIAEKKPEVPDQKTPAQLNQRLMYQQCTGLWHLQSGPEKKAWTDLARPQHMPGYALFMSYCLKPNPGVYLPLAGGQMTGDITMAGTQKIDGVDISTHVLASTGIHGVGAKYIAESAVEDLDLAAHKPRHQDSGADEINLAGLDGEPSTLTTHKALDTGVHGTGANFITQAPAASHLVRTFTKGWTANKYLKGAGINVNPDEVDLPALGANISYNSYAGNNTVNREIVHGLTNAPKLVIIVDATWIYLFHIIRPDVICCALTASKYAWAIAVADSNHFHVGNATNYLQSANATGSTYYWIAIG